MKRRNAIGAVVVAVLALGASIYAFAAPGAGAARSASTATAGSAGWNLSVTGQKQGVFNPGKAIPLSAVSHEIISPRDAQTGLPTGRRQHQPISVTMQWGPTTPKFLNALVSNENLTSVLIGLLQRDRQGKVATVATIKLTNANVSHYVQTGDNVQFDFTYQKITWTWVSGGITAEDDWAPAT
jgi:type VI secretion system secreted protein Hcp